MPLVEFILLKREIKFASASCPGTPPPSHHFEVTACEKVTPAKDKICQSDRNFPTASSGQCHLSYFHPQMSQHG